MPPTSSDGSPAIVIQSPSGPIYIDSVTGDIIGTGAPTVTGGASDATPSGSTMGPGYTNPSTDPTNPAYYHGGDVPPWIKAGYPTFAAWTAGVGASAASDELYRQNQIALQAKQLAATNAATGASTVNANIAARTAAANTAENARQFNEQMGFDKAKYDQDYQFNRGKELLSLGSRPDTLVKYLYALQGQQTPQGLQNTTANLPGFQNVLGTTNYGTSAPSSTPTITSTSSGAAPVAAAPQIAAAQQQTAQRVQQGAALAPNSGVALSAPLPNIGPNGTAPNLVQPSLQLAKTAAGVPQIQAPTSGGAVGIMPTSSVLANVQTNAAGASAPISLSDYAVKNGFKLAPYAKGGVIPEPVIGIGQRSGQMYQFGEQGPETVVPAGDTLAEANDRRGGVQSPDAVERNRPHQIPRGTPPPMPGHPPKAQGVIERLMHMPGDIHYSEDDGTIKRSIKVNHYATGGTIGYDPSQTPSLGQNAGGFFNDPNLANVVSRGYNSNPGVPLFPQVGLATNGGQSLIPSAQRMNALLPSEQQLYAGTLQDEFGAQPEDVFTLARKLAPQVSSLRTPNYTA